MNRASLICNCINEQEKAVKILKSIHGDEVNAELITIRKQQILDKHKEKWAIMCDINNELTDIIMNKRGITKHNWFIVSVRPNDTVDLKTFINTVEKYILRKQIYNYKLTLEQACVDGSGNGFHMHAIVDAYWKSQSDALHETYKTFKKIAAFNCIEVTTTRNPGEFFERYCIEYECEDHDKKKTQNGDAIWRARHKILPYYDSLENRFSALSIKSVKTVQNSINPFIIEMA